MGPPAHLGRRGILSSGSAELVCRVHRWRPEAAAAGRVQGRHGAHICLISRHLTPCLSVGGFIQSAFFFNSSSSLTSFPARQGHAESAAGVVGLLQAVHELSAQAVALPLPLRTVNPYIASLAVRPGHWLHVGRGLGPAARSDSSNIPVVGVSRYNEGSDGCILAME